MASPQVQNGYVEIANEVLEALSRTPLSNYESRIVWCVIRKTYGWKKKEDWIALSQFVTYTGISKPHVCRALRMLLARKIVTKGGTKYHPTYGFQKDYEKWSLLPKGAPLKTHQVLPKGVIERVPKGAHTKETITKETYPAKLEGKLKTKPKTMKGYNENESQDEGPVVDADSGLLVEPPKKSHAKWPDAQKVFDLFDDNPARALWRVRPAQREAAQVLFRTYGLEELKTRYGAIKRHRGEPMCPLIDSPIDFLEKMPKMEAYLKSL